MWEKFYPKEYIPSAYEIDFAAYYAAGYRGILFDVDNTLVPHGAPVTPQAEALFDRLRGIGFATCLISNNGEERVAPFAEAVGSPYLHKAGKPGKKGYRAALGKMGVSEGRALFVGDQIFTDIYGANRCGMYTILTEPIHPKEEIQIVLKRYLEKIVLFFYRRRKKQLRK
ncbi:MAG: YqeG family HAD IIIA-type phosphatase [Lachnospiraceae bacterium]|nr:YqeG family HAD IIIA-type phosphatase [Lachnospiraceae bacterium]